MDGKLEAMKVLIKNGAKLEVEDHLPLSAGANLRLILGTCYFRYLKIPLDKQLTELVFLSF